MLSRVAQLQARIGSRKEMSIIPAHGRLLLDDGSADSLTRCLVLSPLGDFQVLPYGLYRVLRRSLQGQENQASQTGDPQVELEEVWPVRQRSPKRQTGQLPAIYRQNVDLRHFQRKAREEDCFETSSLISPSSSLIGEEVTLPRTNVRFHQNPAPDRRHQT